MKIALSWSTGKDSALALYRLQMAGKAPALLFTTYEEGSGLIPIQGGTIQQARIQADAIGLPLLEIALSSACPNEDYERRVAKALKTVEGLTHIAFGDLFLADIRAFRERFLLAAGLTALFPLWGEDTAALARELKALGLKAKISSVNPQLLEPQHLGVEFADFCPPSGVDPCGENGEFHTVVYAGPIFQKALPMDFLEPRAWLGA